MSHPLFYPGTTFFYPIGNTSAVRLTEHLPPEQPASILLLGCGDPRHILYTIYTHETGCDVEHQKLDVTCCDIEAAVLARNALLFTLLADDDAQQRLDLIWNIFYHFMLDQASLSLLVEQCRKLVTLAKDLESWKAGPYAHFLLMCDEHTLSQVRRFWGLYVATAEYDEDHRERFRKCFLDGMKEMKDKLAAGSVVTSSRSAGPLLHLAPKVVAEQFRNFWSTGVTNDGLRSMEQATLVNPTFGFSAAGEKFSVHYGVDPVAGFHLAEVFANPSSYDQTDAILAQKVVQAARSQFTQWCTAVVGLLGHGSTTPSNFVIRLFAGDALMLCQAFCHVNSCSVTATPIPVSPWKSTRIEFDDQYAASTPAPAPAMFNVIHTSNLSDHVGILNLLLVTTPILSKSPSATLYTEALLSSGDSPSTGILEQLCGDVETISLLLGIVPSAVLSQFTTRSNVHESLLQVLNPSATQHYHHFTWKSIVGEYPLSFAPDQLAQVLFSIYLKMFSDENIARQMQTMSTSPTRAIQEATLLHYTRRSFVQLLSHVKSRVRANWDLVMERFDDQLAADSSLILGSNFYQEMCCYFHLLDVVTFTSMEPWYINELRVKEKSTIFRDWETIPAVVTVVLVVPRHKITAVEYELRKAGTPILLCEIRSTSLWNMFAHVSAAYGKLEITGAGQKKSAIIMPDEEGESASSLVVFFSAPSSSLMLSSNAMVGLRTRPTPHTSRSSLLIEAIFKAKLEDSQQVHIIAEPPRPPNTPPTTTHTHTRPTLESENAFDVKMDASCTKIRSFTLRVDIEDMAGQASLAAGSPVKIEQTSAHGARLYIDKYSKVLGFPLPVDARNTQLRVARKSMFVEVIAPLGVSMGIQSERSIANRFITALEANVPSYWNVHRVNIDHCPLITTSDPGASKWLVPHVSFMFSERERGMRDKKVPTKDTLINLKESLHTLLLSAAGVNGDQTRSVFGLHNTSTKEFLAFIFVSGLHLDVGSHTVVADAWLTPGTMTIQDLLKEHNVSNVVAIKLDSDESEAWRHLLPLFIERRRTWTHQPSCEYPSQGTIPLYPDAGADAEKSPFCSCGVGIGTKTFPQHLAAIAPYATQVAISPLFPVSFLETLGPASTPNTVAEPKAEPNKCRACGKQAGSRVCGKCKGVRYCSRECQLKDWKVHKKNCA